MKLLLIRMSALATIVALGLIAIAQAQRSAEPEASAADTSTSSPAAPSGQDDANASSSGTSARNPMREFADAARDNPLRTSGEPAQQDLATAPAERSDAISSGRAVGAFDASQPAVAAPPMQPDPTQPNADGAPLAAEPALAVAAPARDPFPAMGSPGNDAASASGEHGEQVAMAGEGLRSADPPFRNIQIDEAAAQPSQLPELPPLVETAESAPASPRRLAESPAAPSSVESPEAGRPPNTAESPVADAREPGRFPFESNGRVSSLPASPSGADRPALSDMRGTLDSRRGRDAAALSPPGSGVPGSRELDGPQTPQLTIQKFPPEEVQVGREATFRVKVTNSGQTAAHGVRVHDEVPRGTRLVATDPPSSRDAQGKLVWELETLQPGEEASVEMRLMPEEEGEIGSVATVSFAADASARVVATKPELTVRTSAPDQVMIGEEFEMTITLSNPGSGIAYDVVLEEHVPPGLQHVAGEELEYAVGDLKPNETRELDLTLVAERPGMVTNLLRARAEANLNVENRLEIDVISPQLDVALDGPKHRYLERQATYELSISNVGTAPARNVELVAHLPAGLDYVAANNKGEYEAATRTVHWMLEELPVKKPGSVRLTTMPVEMGEQNLRFVCTGEPGLAVEGEQPVVVEGIAAILFQVVDVEDPIEVGGETTYEIRVVNQGSKAATNVWLEATMPPGMRAVAAEGPASYRIDGNRVYFEGLPRLAPKADTTYRVRVQGLQPGDQRLSVKLQTAEMDTPVTKEESTRVYSDQ